MPDSQEAVNKAADFDVDATGEWSLSDGIVSQKPRSLKIYHRFLGQWRGKDVIISSKRSWAVVQKGRGELDVARGNDPKIDVDDVLVSIVSPTPDKIFAIEHGKHCLLSVDGIGRKQALVSTFSPTNLELHKRSLIVCPSGLNYGSSPDIPPGTPPEKLLRVQKTFEGIDSESLFATDQTLLIGAAAECAINLRGCPDFVAGIAFHKAGVVLFAIEGESGLVEGIDASMPVLLPREIGFRIGGNGIQLKLPESMAAAELAKVERDDQLAYPDLCMLIVRSAAAEGFDRVVIPGRDIAVTIGRQKDNDLALSHSGVSRHHAKLIRAGGGIEVADLGSSNGTYVNGERVSVRHCHPGDLVSLGDSYDFLICYDV